jgi:tetratricopeptide (TPR) repeat protein
MTRSVSPYPGTGPQTIIMKSVLVAASVFLVLFTGCRNADVKKPTAVPAPSEQAPKSEALTPYYYGLIEEYRTILEEDPNNLAAVIALGNAYFDSGQWNEAIRLYERALAINPRSADVHTDMGTAYRNMGRSDRALAEYRRALELEPGQMDARYNLGVVYAYDVKDYRRAIAIWNQVLRLDPNYPEADAIRAAIAKFKKALKKDVQ